MPARDTVIKTIIAVLFACTMYNIPFAGHPGLTDVGPTWLGLDVSWQMTLNYANIKGWTWGKDIVYTYGPLGYLAVRTGWGASRWGFLAMDLFVMFNFFCLFKSILTYDKSLVSGIIKVFLITIMVFSNHGSDQVWLMLFFCAFWLHKIYLSKKVFHPAYILVFILIVLPFFIKLNAGLIGILLLAGFLAVMVFTNAMKLIPAVVILLIPILLIIFFADLLHVAIPDYITYALDVISGYNMVMYMHEDHVLLEIVLHVQFLLIAWIAIKYLISQWKSKEYVKCYFSLFVLGFIFLLRKQSVLRDDVGHMIEFIAYAPLVLFYGGFDTQRFFNWKKDILVFGVIVLSLVGVSQVFSLKGTIINRYTYLPTYIQELRTFDPNDYEKQADKRKIPERILSRIGTSSVDVFPWDSEYALENHLDYTPRPMFQSFSAYTKNLAVANFEFYQRTPPQYVIYDFDAIEGRYPLNDDPLSSMYLSRNYSVMDSFTSNERWRLCLKLNDDVTKLKLKEIGKKTIDSKEEVPIDGAQYISVKLGQSVLGFMLSFLDQPQPLSISYQTEDGSWHDHRISPPMLQSGMLVDRYVGDNKQFAQYLETPDSLTKVVAIKLLPAPFCYSSTAEVFFYDIEKE